jgi:hypothetical protein
MAVGVPFTYYYLDSMLRDIKDLTLPEGTDASLFTYHSFRITLATQLGNCTSMKVEDVDIQAVCRWQSEQSLKVYNRMQPDRHIALLDAAMGTKISSYLSSNLPTIDNSEWREVLNDAAHMP